MGVAAQINVPFLITVSGSEPIRSSAEIEQLIPVLDRSGELGIWALVKNEGNRHVAVRNGRARVSIQGGAEIGALEFPASTPILPTSTEYLVSRNRLTLPESGSYLVEASVDLDSGTRSNANVVFGTSASLHIADLKVQSNQSGPTAIIEIVNDGEVGLLPQGILEIHDEQGVALAQGSTPAPGMLRPGEAAQLQVGLPRSMTGMSSITASIGYGPNLVARRVRQVANDRLASSSSSGEADPGVWGANTTDELTASLPSLRASAVLSVSSLAGLAAAALAALSIAMFIHWRFNCVRVEPNYRAEDDLDSGKESR
jgi:hypothetical protein